MKVRTARRTAWPSCRVLTAVGLYRHAVDDAPTPTLTELLGRALSEARAGATLVQALEHVARRTSRRSPASSTGASIAVERGTPLAEVLRAQAVDVREAGRRQLLESACRKEIAMMAASAAVT